MKIFYIILLVLPFYGYSQGYDNGFKEGFKNGYCYGQGASCIAPIAPVTPIPLAGESINDYMSGYNRGYETGYNSRDNKSYNNSTYKVVEPARYEQPISNDILVAGAIAKEKRSEIQLQNLRAIQDNIVELIKQVIKCDSTTGSNLIEIYEDNINTIKNTQIRNLDEDYTWIYSMFSKTRNLVISQLNNCN